MVFRWGKITTPYSRFFFGKRNLFWQSLGLEILCVSVMTIPDL